MTDDADADVGASTVSGIDENHLAMYSLLGSRLLRVTTARRLAAAGLRLAADAEVS
ncbi:hypothetical protein ACFV4G_07375 [Kitasatospora sp. NPDC059747]|uniref:hypothetical protein n=1 Tax=Kitasatospora sp. NPDC059747 TaxID=3346930 RepID=UPI0036545D67